MKYRFLQLLILFASTQIIYARDVPINKGSGSFIINGGGNHQTASIICPRASLEVQKF